MIASVGVSLRLLTHGGRNLVVPFEADEIRPGYRGANLAPWQNRIADWACTLSERGLSWRNSATNVGAGVNPVPYGVGPHPYIVAGSGSGTDLITPAPVERHGAQWSIAAL